MAKRVLICDDAGFMRSLLKDILTSEGYEVAGEAPDGQAGVQMYQDLRPDLVTMDISMVGHDGMAVFNALKKLDPKVKVLVISGNSQKKIYDALLAAGVSGYVPKPINPEELKSKIASLAAA